MKMVKCSILICAYILKFCHYLYKQNNFIKLWRMNNIEPSEDPQFYVWGVFITIQMMSES